MKSLRRILIACAIAAVSAASIVLSALPAAAQKRWALAIGINDYPNLRTTDDPSNGQLRKAVADAETMAAVLRALNFDVEIARNVDLRGFLEAIERLKGKISRGDTVFLFFAGHGVAFDGANFLLPSDISGGSDNVLLKRLSIGEIDIIEGLREKGAALVILTLDACRDNPIEEFQRKLARAQGRTFRSSGAMRSIGVVPRPSAGVFSIYSAGIGERALDSHRDDSQTERNSVFTRVFASKLRVQGRSLQDVVLDVRTEVTELARRMSHQQTPAYYDQSPGRIFLAGPGIPPVPPPPDPDAAVRADYELARRVGTIAAWDAFLSRYSTGFHADLARAERSKLVAVPPPVRPPASPPVGGPFVPSPLVPGTLWSHNDSIVRLIADGTSRKFYYERPRPGLSEAGAARGTLLFEGHRLPGDRYAGTAYVFAGRCGSFPYSVSGDVTDNHRIVTMTGRAPVVNRSTCETADYVDDELVFELQEPAQ